MASERLLGQPKSSDAVPLSGLQKRGEGRPTRSMSLPGTRPMKTPATHRSMTHRPMWNSPSRVDFRTTTSVRRPARPRVWSGGCSLFEDGALECNGPYVRSVSGQNTFRDVFKPWLDRTLLQRAHATIYMAWSMLLCRVQ